MEHIHGPTGGRKLWLSLIFTLVFCAGEAFAGIISHSLALLSDAGHNLTDALALGLAAYAVWAAKRPADERHTYGHFRVSTLTALFNSSTLVVIALIIGVEAFSRLRQPQAVGGTLMIWVAAGSVLMNTVIAIAPSGDAKKSLNSKAAFVHMAGDALSSLAVVVAGIVVHYTRWSYADPVVSILIAVFILLSAFDIVRETTDTLMEKVPRELDLILIAEKIQAMTPVCGVHDLHIWTVGEGRTLLSCHVALPAGCSLEQCSEVIDRICVKLRDDFAITHATIQPEVNGLCAAAREETLLCTMGDDSSPGMQIHP